MDELYANLMTTSAQLWGWVGIAISLLVLLYLMHHAPDCIWPLLIGWGVRVAFCAYNTYVYTLPVDSFEPDAYMLSAYPLTQIMGAFGPNSDFYRWFCAVIYFEFGRSPLLLQAINIIFYLFIVWNIYRISRRLAGPRAARLALWGLAIFPASIVWSTVILRESLCIFAITSGVYHWIRSLERGNLLHYLLAIAFFLLAALTHYGCIVLVLGLGLAPLLRFFGPSRGYVRRTTLTFSIGLIFLTALLFAGLFYGGLYDKISPQLNLDELTALDIGHGLGVAARSRAAYLPDMRPHTLLDVVWQYPIRAFCFLFLPFPWMLRTALDALGVVDTLFYWAGLWLIWKRRKLVLRDIRALGCLMFFALGVAMFCMGTSNYGTAMRHRGKFFPILTCVVAYVWVIGEHEKRKIAEAAEKPRQPALTRSGRQAKRQEV